MVRGRIAMLLAALASGQALAVECSGPLGATAARAETERYTVVYRTVPESVTVGRAFTLEAQICAKGRAVPPTGLRVDAHMPAHRHGMNYRPTVAVVGAGRFRAEGLLFHMPGRWQFIFDLDAPGVHERITQDLLLE